MGRPVWRASGFVRSQDGLFGVDLCVKGKSVPSDGMWRRPFPFPDLLTVGPWGGGRGQGERFQGGAGGLGVPPFLGTGHPTWRGPGQRGVPRSPGAPCGAPPAPTADICSRSSSSAGGPCPAHSVPCLLPLPLQSLDCRALDASARFVPGFSGLSLCTSGRGR